MRTRKNVPSTPWSLATHLLEPNISCVRVPPPTPPHWDSTKRIVPCCALVAGTEPSKHTASGVHGPGSSIQGASALPSWVPIPGGILDATQLRPVLATGALVLGDADIHPSGNEIGTQRLWVQTYRVMSLWQTQLPVSDCHVCPPSLLFRFWPYRNPGAGGAVSRDSCRGERLPTRNQPVHAPQVLNKVRPCCAFFHIGLNMFSFSKLESVVGRGGA